MPYTLKTINERVRLDAREFAGECDREFDEKVMSAAERAADNLRNSPVILLCGPSASGKTTTAKKLSEKLEKLGIRSHTVSLDDYFFTVTPEGTPRNPEGEYDFESPQCVDFELIGDHYDRLTRGESVALPVFDFPKKSRIDGSGPSLLLGRDEAIIYEGIHALNDRLAGRNPEACGIFINAGSSIELPGGKEYEGRWIRFTRRLVRDYNFRATGAGETFKLWRGVVRGEKLYIAPFLKRANIRFDSVLPYEMCAFRPIAEPMLRELKEKHGGDNMTDAMAEAIRAFEEMPLGAVSESSLIREFTGL